MKLAVVIPALDEADRIAGAVASAIVDGESGVEVVVVDGGSRDDTAERAARAGARVLRSERGRARQFEVGVGATSSDSIILLHADTRLAPGWSGAVVRALQDPEVVGGAFRFQFDEADGAGGPSAALRFVQWGARLRSERLGLPYGDQALFVRRSALGRVGGIPQVAIMEDLDLVAALRREGRLALLELPATTSGRRYLEHGVFRTMGRHWLAAAAWGLGVPRERIAAWVRP